MTLKRLTRELKWGLHTYPYFQMHIDTPLFKGWAAVNLLTDGDYFYMKFPQSGEKPVVGEGMKWLTLIPDDKKRSITTFLTKDNKISCWYIDVIEDIQICDDGVLAFHDKYLDVLMTPEGEYFIDDEDELEAAWKSGELSDEQYQQALNEGQAILQELASDISSTEKWCLEIFSYIEKQIAKNQFALFLDVDGVLDIYDPAKEVQDLLPEAINRLSKLVKHNAAKVIIISDWRFGSPKLKSTTPPKHRDYLKLWNHLVNTLESNGIQIYDVTPHQKDLANRTEEIKAYLQKHPEFQRFAILDDCFGDDYSSDPNIKSHLVFVDALKGLQDKDMMATSLIMNRIE